MRKLSISWPRLNLSFPSQTLHKSFSSSSSSPSSSSYMVLTQHFYEALKPITTLSNTRKIHAQIISIGLCSSTFLQNNVLNTYLNCGSLLDASKLFDEIVARNLISYNIMINGFCKFGELNKAEKMFDGMLVRDCTTWNTLMSGYYQNGLFRKAVRLFILITDKNTFSFTCAIKACSIIKCDKLAIQFLGLVEKTEFKQDPQVRESLVDLFAKCGLINTAHKLFDEIPNPNISCCNSLLLGYSKVQRRKALQFFSQMHKRDIKPDSTTYTCTLSACSSISNLIFGEKIHARILKTVPKLDEFVGSALVDLYAKSGRLKMAKRIFDSLSLDQKNTFSWTAIIGGFCNQGLIKQSVELFNQMRKEREGFNSDEFTIVTLISACYDNANLLDFFLARQLHQLCIKTGQISALAVSNALISMYAKQRDINSAKLVFDLMSHKDIISYTSMITLYSQIGEVEFARTVFDEMPERNIITWNAILGNYIQNGHENEGLKMYCNMLIENIIKPDCVTFVTLFKACADVASVKIGNQIFGHTIKLGFHFDLSLCNAIITMYSNCGRLKEAKEIFDFINKKDIISFNAMITAYSHHGMGQEAIETFELMLENKIKPDYVSYVAVLSGCRHVGLVEKGKHYFDSMSKIHNIIPGLEHYSCMVDLLGRAGLLEEAKGIIVNMPVKPTAQVWGALLANCKLHQNAELAEYCAKHLFELNNKDSGSYMLLSKVYADVGSSAESAEVRKLMRDKGVKKKPGYSWIEIDNKTHVFSADESCHSQIVAIKAKLEGLIDKIVEVGYVKTRESELAKYHSEKLAVVFGLMSLPDWMPIYIMKNLRICNDCHDFMKFASLVTCRELVVRDPVRFHHFKDGFCSCKDYW